MLILSRHLDESIIVTASNGERAKITIVAIRGDKVRLGIEAPPTVTAHREEIQEIVDREGRR